MSRSTEAEDFLKLADEAFELLDMEIGETSSEDDLILSQNPAEFDWCWRCWWHRIWVPHYDG